MNLLDFSPIQSEAAMSLNPERKYFIRIDVWKHTEMDHVIVYRCFQNLHTKEYAVQSADFLRASERNFDFDKQAIELFTETAPLERCKWFSSLEDAIKVHEDEFS